MALSIICRAALLSGLGPQSAAAARKRGETSARHGFFAICSAVRPWLIAIAVMVMSA